MNPLLLASATELARRIRDRELTSRTVVQAHIARILEVNPRRNAVVHERFAAALAEADRADADLASGSLHGPLHGVPCTIKEAFGVTGMSWTSGLKSRTGTTASVDAITVQRLRAAGAIVMGVTNTSELCMWMESDNAVHGRTTNAYSERHIAGGSSGGEGSIVGAGGSPFGLGSDVGGSIRMPAFFNGVFGHKPGVGVVPNSGQFPMTPGEDAMRLLSSGPLCRSAEDLYPLLQILTGADGVDPLAHDGALGDPATVSLSGLNVLDVPDNGLIRVSADLRAAQVRVRDALVAQGAVAREVRYPALKKSFEIWSTAMGDASGPGAFLHLMGYKRRLALLPHLLRPYELGGPHTVPAILLGLLEDVGSISPRMAESARRLRTELRAQIIDDLGDGVMLFPSYPRTAPRHRVPWLMPLHWTYTAVLNALGLPVTQVPTGLDASGLPTGLQIVAAPGRDHVAMAVAVALEQAGVARWTPPSA